MSAQITDTTLAAYHHGRLPAETARDIRHALVRDPELRTRYRTLVREIEFLTGLLDASLVRSHRPELEARIRAAARPVAATASRAPPAAVGAMPTVALRRPRVAGWQALAASVLVAAGIGLGLGLSTLEGGVPAGGDAEIPALEAARQDSLHWALEYVSSGLPELRVAEDQRWKVEVTPIRTFRNTSGDFCREYIEIWQVAGGDARGQLGVACRERQGGWRSVANLPVY